MKKILVSIVAVLACAGMNAQFIAGGSLNLSSQKPDNSNLENANSLSISPFIGYQLDDKLIIGADLSYSSSKNLNNMKDFNSSSYSFAPFAMYKFYESGMVRFHAKASVGTTHFKSESPVVNPISGETYTRTTKTDMLRFGISPVFEFAATENLSLMSSFGFLGFDKTWDTSSKLSLSLSSSLAFGVYYKF